MLLSAGARFTANSVRAFTIGLERPFPLMLQVLGKPNAPVPFILPARIVAAAGDGRIKEVVGSGPFRFEAESWRPGNSMTLLRFADYAPRREPPDFLAGGKVVHVDQVVLKTISDDATGASALIAGEVAPPRATMRCARLASWSKNRWSTAGSSGDDAVTFTRRNLPAPT